MPTPRPPAIGGTSLAVTWSDSGDATSDVIAEEHRSGPTDHEVERSAGLQRTQASCHIGGMHRGVAALLQIAHRDVCHLCLVLNEEHAGVFPPVQLHMGINTGDALVGATLDELPTNGVVATGSLRRRAQLAHLRPDLQFQGLRGNMATRLAKAGEFEAIVVAEDEDHSVVVNADDEVWDGTGY